MLSTRSSPIVSAKRAVALLSAILFGQIPTLHARNSGPGSFLGIQPLSGVASARERKLPLCYDVCSDPALTAWTPAVGLDPFASKPIGDSKPTVTSVTS
jgi:hypothetical protein